MMLEIQVLVCYRHKNLVELHRSMRSLPSPSDNWISNDKTNIPFRKLHKVRWSQYRWKTAESDRKYQWQLLSEQLFSYIIVRLMYVSMLQLKQVVIDNSKNIWQPNTTRDWWFYFEIFELSGVNFGFWWKLQWNDHILLQTI
jgi:hypothetical protein